MVDIDYTARYHFYSIERYQVPNSYQEYMEDITRAFKKLIRGDHYNKKWLLDRIPTYSQWIFGISGDILPIYFDALIYCHLRNKND